MSIVPPARSMRVGAEALTSRGPLYWESGVPPARPGCATIPHVTMAPLHRRIGQLAIVGFAGTSSVPVELRSLAREFDLGGVILFARNVEAPGAGRRAGARGTRAGARPAALGQRRPGRRPRRAAAAPVHRVAADGDARAQRRRARSPTGSRARWRASCGRSASRSTTRRCSTSTPTRPIRSSATARCTTAPEVVAGWAP